MFKAISLSNLLDFLSFEENEKEVCSSINHYLNTTDFEILKKELNPPIDQVSILNHLAASNNIQVIKCLMDYDKTHHFFINWNHQCDKDKNHTPLLKAIYRDNVEVVDLLLKHHENGASIDFLVKDNCAEYTALSLCVRKAYPNSLNILNCLLNYAKKANLDLDLYQENELGYGLISNATNPSGDIQLRMNLVSRLIQAGYNCNHVDSREQSFYLSFLYLADETESVNIFKTMYDNYHTQIQLTDKDLKNLIKASVYLNEMSVLNYFYTLAEFETMNNIEYAKEVIKTKPSNIILGNENIYFFEEKYKELIKKERDNLDAFLINKEIHQNKKIKM